MFEYIDRHHDSIDKYYTQFGIKPVDKHTLKSSLDGIDRFDKHAPIILSSLGRICLMEGDVYNALKFLNKAVSAAELRYDGQAMSTTNIPDDDMLASIYVEGSRYSSMVDDVNESVSFLKKASLYAGNPKLSVFIDVLLNLTMPSSKARYPFDFDNKQLDRLFELDMTVQFVESSISYSRILIEYHEYKKATKIINKALKSSSGFPHYCELLEILLSRILGNQGKAIEKLERIVESSLSPFHRILSLQQLGHLHVQKKDYKKAISFYLKAINISDFPRASILMIDHLLTIASLHKNYLNDGLMADHFYKRAYEVSIEHIKAGLPLSGGRLRAIQNFTSHMKNELPTQKKSDVSDESIKTTGLESEKTTPHYFEFSNGKSWNEIRQTFLYNLLIWGHRKSKNSKVHEFLKMSYGQKILVTNQLRKIGFSIPDFRVSGASFSPKDSVKGLQDYLSETNIQDWKLVQKKFEKDFLEYAVNLHGRNKKLVSKKLGINYQVLLNKLRKGSVNKPRSDAGKGKTQLSSETGDIPGENHFKFSDGKSWNEIRQLFQYNVLVWAYRNSKDQKIHEFLKMSYGQKIIVSKQLRKNGFIIPDFRNVKAKFPRKDIVEDIQDYLTKKSITDWKIMQKKFEKDFLSYAYIRYGKNKKSVSKHLKLSYQVLINKMKKTETLY